MRRGGWIALFLFLSTLAVYSPVRNFEFVRYDDPGYVTENPIINNGFTFDGVKALLSANLVGNWVPVTGLSHMLDCQLFGMNAGAHHLMNAVLHALNTALLFLLFYSMTNAQWKSAIVSALFAWHPAHVESVAWISERKDLLSTLFLILTLASYVRYARKGHLAFYLLALICFAIGLIAKPMLVTLPFLLLLLDFWPLQRLEFRSSKPQSSLRSLLLEKVPFIILTILTSVIAIRFQQTAGATDSENLISLGQRAATVPIAYQHYLQMLVWPQKLGLLYLHPFSWPASQIAIALVIIIGLTIGILACWHFRFLPVGWFWFLGTLVPVIGLVQVGEQYMADRYTYISSIGFFVMLVWGTEIMLRRAHVPIQWITTLTVIVLSLCLIRTEQQIPTWRNSITLFEHALTISPRSVTLHGALANAFAQQGRHADAITHYQEVLQVNPNLAEVHGKLAQQLTILGKIEEAITHYRFALQLQPNSTESLNNLAWIFAANNNPKYRNGPEAISLALRAGQLTENKNPVITGTLATAYAENGQYSQAIETAQKARALALSIGNENIAAKNLELMELFRKNQPYHEP